MMPPPTFSKSTSMPLGVAAASWAAQSSARWSTAASKPSWSVSSAHFSGPPAIPTTRAPSALASWPATEPTAPAAADTTTVSPGCGLPMSRIPTHAVSPVIPSAPIYALGEIPSATSTGNKGIASEATAYSCQPTRPCTVWPTT
jgi:hypothetical protein